MKITDISITISDRECNYQGWSANDNRPLRTLLTSATIDNSVCNLTALIKEGQTGEPLIIGFPGYLSDSSGQGIFFDFIDDTYKSYTIVTLNDREGDSRLGSWYLGKPLPSDYYSYLFLIPKLIESLKSKYSPRKVIFYGTSMGGYGSLLHSYFCNVDELYLCVPQTNLSPESHYYRFDRDNYSQERSPFTPSEQLKALNLETPEKYLLATKKHPYIDIRTLSDFITPSKTFSCEMMQGSLPQYVHLVTARYDHPGDSKGLYFSQMILPLLNFLGLHNVHFSMVTFPFAAHDAFIYPQSIVDYSNNYLSPVKNEIASAKGRKTALERLYGEPSWRCFLTPNIYKLWV